MLMVLLARVDFQFEAGEGPNLTGAIVPLMLVLAVIGIAFVNVGTATLARKRKPSPVVDTPTAGFGSKATPKPKSLADIMLPAPLLFRENDNEKRSSPRRGNNPIPIIVSVAGSPVPVEGIVLDRSRGGLRLSLPKSVRVGDALTIRPREAPEDVAWFPVEVRHAQMKEGQWVVGCEFTRELAWAEVLIFG